MDFMSMKNPLTPAGIEPATFRFVVQHLNHCATAALLGAHHILHVSRVRVKLAYIFQKYLTVSAKIIRSLRLVAADLHSTVIRLK